MRRLSFLFRRGWRALLSDPLSLEAPRSVRNRDVVFPVQSRAGHIESIFQVARATPGSWPALVCKAGVGSRELDVADNHVSLAAPPLPCGCSSLLVCGSGLLHWAAAPYVLSATTANRVHSSYRAYRGEGLVGMPNARPRVHRRATASRDLFPSWELLVFFRTQAGHTPGDACTFDEEAAFYYRHNDHVGDHTFLASCSEREGLPCPAVSLEGSRFYYPSSHTIGRCRDA